MASLSLTRLALRGRAPPQALISASAASSADRKGLHVRDFFKPNNTVGSCTVCSSRTRIFRERLAPIRRFRRALPIEMQQRAAEGGQQQEVEWIAGWPIIDRCKLAFPSYNTICRV
jgi:hypothetical protein